MWWCVRQKNEMDKIMYEKGRQLQELEQTNSRIIQDLQAARVTPRPPLPINMHTRGLLCGGMTIALPLPRPG